LLVTKHENLECNLYVIGAKLIKKVKNHDYFVEDLFQDCLKENKYYDVYMLIDALTFLFCIDAIEISDYMVRMKNDIS
jgi:hypothetical protein